MGALIDCCGGGNHPSCCWRVVGQTKGFLERCVCLLKPITALCETPTMTGCRKTRVRGCKAQHFYWLSLSAEGSPWATELLQWKSRGCSCLLPLFDDAITSAGGRECVWGGGRLYRWYHNRKAILIHLCAVLGILPSLVSAEDITVHSLDGESYRASNIALSHIEPVLENCCEAVLQIGKLSWT